MTSARDLLLADDKDVRRAAKRLSKAPAMRRTRAKNLEVTSHSALTHPAMLLDVGLLDMVFDAWRDGSRMLQAAHWTRANPGRQQRVKLGWYYIPYTHEFDAVVDVNWLPFTVLPMALELGLGVRDLDATLRYGVVEKIGRGRLQVKATLKAHHTAIHEVKASLRIDREFTVVKNPRLA